MARKTVAVFFGGRSGEHIVSLRSAASIMDAIDQEQYKIVPVGITREGSWITGSDAWKALWENRRPDQATATVLLTDPTNPGLLIRETDLSDHWRFEPVDLAFPVLHGPYGEDGTIQGLFEMAGLPYVGSGVLASSTGMDKVVMKTLFREQGLPVAKYLSFYKQQWLDQQQSWLEKVEQELGYPAFVKPVNLGSSVGIAKSATADDLVKAVEEAFRYDQKVLIEEFVAGREIECGVIGNRRASASRPGEIIPCNEFYDYRAKYIDDRSELVVPVELGTELEEKIRRFAVAAFHAVEADGLARVDFFLRSTDNSLIINEINTMPGFTSISMYPKMFEASGLKYRELISRLMELAVERYQSRRELLSAPPE